MLCKTRNVCHRQRLHFTRLFSSTRLISSRRSKLLAYSVGQGRLYLVNRSGQRWLEWRTFQLILCRDILLLNVTRRFPSEDWRSVSSISHFPSPDRGRGLPSENSVCIHYVVWRFVLPKHENPLSNFETTLTHQPLSYRVSTFDFSLVLQYLTLQLRGVQLSHDVFRLLFQCLPVCFEIEDFCSNIDQLRLDNKRQNGESCVEKLRVVSYF